MRAQGERTSGQVAAPHHAAAGPQPPQQTTDEFCECWREVRVIEAALEPPLAEGAPPTHRRAHAVVFLGGLTPADVQVHAVAVPGGEQARRELPSLRLWSSAAYANGSYLFEGDLDARALSGENDLLIRVVPSSWWTDHQRVTGDHASPAQEVQYRARGGADGKAAGA